MTPLALVIYSPTPQAHHLTGTALIEISWWEVVHGDPLLPGIYEFESTHPIILSKISDRQSCSVTTSGSESQTSAFTLQRLLIEHDRGDVVTGFPALLVSSHLIPRCIGSDGAQAIVEQFVGVNEANGIHQYDPRIGVPCFICLDHWACHWVHLYEVQDEVGFYHITVSPQM